jgi:hypothetical protein
LAIACLLSLLKPAHADLMSDRDRLATTYIKAGASVRPERTMFLRQRESRAISLAPERRLRKAERRADKLPHCVSVVALSERHISFRLEPVSGAPGDSYQVMLPARVRQSVAGVARIEDCGVGVLSAGGVNVVMDSPRGAVEVLIVRYRLKLSAPELILPARAQGPLSERGEVGKPLRLAPLKQRALRAERVARGEGAKTVVTVKTRASERGMGSISLKLAGGCHRLSVLADPSNAGPVDIDAEVRLRGGNDALRRDRSHAPDARLDFCLGESGPVELRYAGAGGPAPVTVLDAFWPIARGVPEAWGEQARAGLSWALHRRRAPAVVDVPLLQVLGPPGVTVIPTAVEPSTCYLAAFALASGQASAGRLTVLVAGQTRYDDASEVPRGGAVTFCTPPRAEVARLVVELRASGAEWVLSLWRLGSGRAKR